MAKSLLDQLLDSVFDAEWIGKRGEKLTERELRLVNLFGRRGKTLRNVYLPKEDGTTSEVDLLYITQKGIFVFESKNYSGWIFGDEKSQYWTVSLPNREKHRFYNPIRQNRSHIKWLAASVGEDIPLFSLIVFSERCELKRIALENETVKVIKRDRVYAAVREIWDAAPDVLSEERIEDLYLDLRRMTDVDKTVKAAHVETIKNTYSAGKKNAPGAAKAIEAADQEPASLPGKSCPRCGKSLVVRTARSGANAGRQFWGCSGFPACRYTEPLEQDAAAPRSQAVRKGEGNDDGAAKA